MVSKKQQLEWQAQDDAMAMARYHEIMSDKARMNRAIKVAKDRATNLSKQAAAMNAVAKRPSRKK